MEELNMVAGNIGLLGPRGKILHLAAAYGLSDAVLRNWEARIDQCPLDRRVLQEGNPVAIADLVKESDCRIEEIQREGMRSALLLPLRMRGTVSGVVRLYSDQKRNFSPEEIGLAAALVDLGAISLENAKMHQMLKERFETIKEHTDGWYQFLAFS